MAAYEEDLAYIHDVGFGGFARNAAPWLLELLARSAGGLVVDLGCGSGIWAAEMLAAGYAVHGVDISPAMIAMARRRAPEGRFIVGPLLEAGLPPCDAVTALGECVNYTFDPGNSRRALARLFRRVHAALRPGGVFVFDFAEPGQGPPRRGWWQGEDWAVLLEAIEDRARGVLNRRIVTFRRRGKLFRKAEETHVLRLYRAADLAEELRRAGFRVRLFRGYGGQRLPRAHAVLVGRKG